MELGAYSARPQGTVRLLHGRRSSLRAGCSVGPRQQSAEGVHVDPPLAHDDTLGYKQTCGTGVGTFRLDEFSTEGDAGENSLLTITATFTARCESGRAPP